MAAILSRHQCVYSINWHKQYIFNIQNQKKYIDSHGIKYYKITIKYSLKILNNNICRPQISLFLCASIEITYKKGHRWGHLKNGGRKRSFIYQRKLYDIFGSWFHNISLSQYHRNYQLLPKKSMQWNSMKVMSEITEIRVNLIHADHINPLIVLCITNITAFSHVNSYTNWLYVFNTLRPRRNEHFADDIFKRIFFNENVWISI